jgi:hypothetical protein
MAARPVILMVHIEPVLRAHHLVIPGVGEFPTGDNLRIDFPFPVPGKPPVIPDWRECGRGGNTLTLAPAQYIARAGVDIQRVILFGIGACPFMGCLRLEREWGYGTYEITPWMDVHHMLVWVLGRKGHNT